MDFPRPSVSPSNIIGDLKDRFGFGGAKQRAYDEEPYYDEYDEYGYDDAGSYDSGDQYASSSQADPYDRLEYTTRSTAGHQSRTSSFASSYTTSPHLVSSSDIRATTSAYGVSAGAVGDDSFAAAGRPARSSSYAAPSSPAVLDAQETEQYDVPATAYGDFVSPYKEHARQGGTDSSQISSVAGNKTNSAGTTSRSAGLDSLFTPSTGSEKASTASISASSYSSSLCAPSGNVSNSSAEVISGGGTSNSSLGTGGSFSSREITLLQPVSYEDVASVARSVKLGNIVVLSLRSTDSALAKRVLDFSFGVASALDARVDCVADKTFIVVQGGDLSLEERHRLQKQGIL